MDSTTREDTMLAWLLSSDEQNEPLIHFDILSTIVHNVYVCHDSKDFIDELRTMRDEQIFVVLGIGHANVISSLLDYTWITCIYLCENHPYLNMTELKNFISVRGPFFDPNDLFLQLINDIPVLSKSYAHLTFSCSYHDEASAHMLQRDTAAFLWSQLFLEQILQNAHRPNNSDVYKDMIDECHLLYQRNHRNLDIEEFRSTYSPNNAILWYSKESFVYNLFKYCFILSEILLDSSIFAVLI